MAVKLERTDKGDGMDKVSIIIPVRGEKIENLQRTLDSIYENATGEFEIIVGVNGPPFDMFEKLGSKCRVIFIPENIGIKGNINFLATLATGKYLFKLDAHCAVGKGFDEILKADMQDDWVVMPRFKIIKNDWSIQVRDGQEEFYDYFYLSCPFTDPRGLRFKAGGHWPERTKERLESHPGVDETPQIHGSGWFMTKDRFFELGGFPLQDPYGHGQEPLWIALKNWVKGGKVMVNKKTWYAHLHQDSKNRGYPEDKAHTEKTYNLTAQYWLNHLEFEWFIEKFMPMPSWPENWRQLLLDWRIQNG
jgi:glycosyltransferase involved in cell wall biosynthesis